MMWKFTSLLLVLTIHFAKSQDDIDEIIGGIFNLNNVTTSSTITGSTKGKCICVPYYQCDPDTKTITDDADGSEDGYLVIDIRYSEIYIFFLT